MSFFLLSNNKKKNFARFGHIQTLAEIVFLFNIFFSVLPCLLCCTFVEQMGENSGKAVWIKQNELFHFWYVWVFYKFPPFLKNSSYHVWLYFDMHRAPKKVKKKKNSSIFPPLLRIKFVALDQTAVVYCLFT